MSLQLDPRIFRLDYLYEYKLGGLRGPKRAKVLLKLSDISRAWAENYRSSSLPWRLARELEGRADAPEHEGVWPINHWRVERRFGDVSELDFPQGSLLNEASQAVRDIARKFRLFCYCRVNQSDEAIRILDSGLALRYSCEVTEDWYDPADGIVVTPGPDAIIRGSHAVELHAYLKGNDLFVFPNSWGEKWGYEGRGAFDRDYFDKFIVEAWHTACRGFQVPTDIKSGIIVLEWKWSFSHDTSVYGFEIVDAVNDDRLGWAFCRKRQEFLDIEEFFVWPQDRLKGYARVLAKSIKQLADRVQLPMRMLVSFADSSPDNLGAVEAVARLLGLTLSESQERWVHLFGLTPTHASPFTRIPPQRPALILELLRPKDEAPLPGPIQYQVLFGTNRQPLDSNDASKGFSNQRGTRLFRGLVQVEIPRTHKFGSSGSWWLKGWRKLIMDSYSAAYITPELSVDKFIHFVTVSNQAFEEPHNLLYIHGYNTTFDAAVLQAARFGVDLKIRGSTFLYSWPSSAVPSGYAADEAAIEASHPYVNEFISSILDYISDAPLHIVAHSMGNRAIIKFLESADWSTNSKWAKRIGQVIFAAPDVDTDVFRSAVPKFHSNVGRATLYTARDDLALYMSNILHGYSRAGLAPPVLVAKGLDTVLVEGFGLFNLSHNYHATTSDLLHDIFFLINYNRPPSERPRPVAVHREDGERYWKIVLA